VQKSATLRRDSPAAGGVKTGHFALCAPALPSGDNYHERNRQMTDVSHCAGRPSRVRHSTWWAETGRSLR